jgi:hypothetical protein
MTHLTHLPAYLVVEDRVNTREQKYRIQRIVRGPILWIVVALAGTLVVALNAMIPGVSGHLSLSMRQMLHPHTSVPGRGEISPRMRSRTSPTPYSLRTI